MTYLERLLLCGFVLVGAAGCYAAKSKDVKIPLENTSQPDNMKSLEILNQLINNANASILQEQSLSKIKELFKKIISHNKADKIAANFDRAINIVQYYMFDDKNHKESLLDVLIKMKNAVEKLNKARSWSDIKTALDNFSPFGKVKFSTSWTTPQNVRDGVNKIVDTLNKTIVNLKTLTQKKANEEKQIISDSAKKAVAATKAINELGNEKLEIANLKDAIDKLNAAIAIIKATNAIIGTLTAKLTEVLRQMEKISEATTLKARKKLCDDFQFSDVEDKDPFEIGPQELELTKILKNAAKPVVDAWFKTVEKWANA